MFMFTRHDQTSHPVAEDGRSEFYIASVQDEAISPAVLLVCEFGDHLQPITDHYALVEMIPTSKAWTFCT